FGWPAPVGGASGGGLVAVAPPGPGWPGSLLDVPADSLGLSPLPLPAISPWVPLLPAPGLSPGRPCGPLFVPVVSGTAFPAFPACWPVLPCLPLGAPGWGVPESFGCWPVEEPEPVLPWPSLPLSFCSEAEPAFGLPHFFQVGALDCCCFGESCCSPDFSFW